MKWVGEVVVTPKIKVPLGFDMGMVISTSRHLLKRIEIWFPDLTISYLAKIK